MRLTACWNDRKNNMQSLTAVRIAVSSGAVDRSFDQRRRERDGTQQNGPMLFGFGWGLTLMLVRDASIFGQFRVDTYSRFHGASGATIEFQAMCIQASRKHSARTEGMERLRGSPR